jgi:diadenosine tetraphosphate (Ap4A) HIT family hydrolase
MTNISYESPFFKEYPADWLCSNDLAFAIFDKHPVSYGHTLITTRRIVKTWFDATELEQFAMMSLINEVKLFFELRPATMPDGYNVGFNAGVAAGQTVPHAHIHVIPRYHGDMDDPRGGVRHCIPEKGNYITKTY